MAGTIENTQIAIVHHDGIVPNEYTLRANVIYGPVNPHVVPWEAEALWAAEDPYQTVNALKACQHDGGEIWDIYEPTPMTREWLVKNGFLDGDL
jgi:3',5'-cyclic AMP phosphodiesterase CpdA